LSAIISIRLHPAEVQKVDALMQSNQVGCESRGEFFRLLLHREWGKRTRRCSKVSASEWQSAARIGRPRLARLVEKEAA
jgi:hypothetical protein